MSRNKNNSLYNGVHLQNEKKVASHICMYIRVCVSQKFITHFSISSISFTSTVHGRAGYGSVRRPARRQAFTLTTAAAGHGQTHCTRRPATETSRCTSGRGRCVAVSACSIWWMCVRVRLLMVLMCSIMMLVMLLLVLVLVHVRRFLIVLLVAANGSHARRCCLPQTVCVVWNVEAVCAMRYQIQKQKPTHTTTFLYLYTLYLPFMCLWRSCRTCCSINCLNFIFIWLLKLRMWPSDGHKYVDSGVVSALNVIYHIYSCCSIVQRVCDYFSLFVLFFSCFLVLNFFLVLSAPSV